MDKTSKIHVAGHTGMVGGAVMRALRAQGYENIITRTHAELPLDDARAVDDFYKSETPEYVFLAAAKVGGIIANDTQGGDFIRENLNIQTHVIDAARRCGARKLLFLGSSCIYPRLAEQPIKEDSLLTGPLEETNLPYAAAKIAGKVMCDAYRKQYGFDAFTVMPCNVYGPGDNFHPEHSHVIAGLMRRFHEAARSGAENVTVWGSGAPQRELMHADDLADACVFLMNRYTDGGMINAGSSHEVSVRELAEMMKDITGFTGALTFDSSRPDGTPRKIMDNSRIEALGWQARTPLREGLKNMYQWFLENAAGA